MNKKVLTLCVSALLASTVMASAADPVLPQDYVPVTITPGKVIGDAVENLPLESDGKLYHLAAEGVYVGGEKSDISVQNQVLSLTENGTIQLTDLSKADASSVGTDNAWTSSLWCVHITKEAAGQNMIFDFTNSMRGMMLSVSVEGWDKWTGTETTESGATVKYNPSVAANSDGGEVSGWKFYPVYDKMTGSWFLGSYVNDDGRTMAVLAYDKAEGKDAVVGVKVIDNATYANEVSGLLRFTLNEAVDKVLTADEFNTILGTLTEDEAKEGVQLTFVEDSNHPDFPNLFSQTKIHAEEAGDGFVYLYKVADYKDDVVANRSYIHVDTAYTNANSSSKFLQFAYMEQGKGVFGQDNSKLTYIGGLGKFAIYYNATEKRIYLRAKAVYNKPEGITYWSQLTKDNSEVISIDDLNATDKGLKNWVDLQDLVGSDDLRIITIKTDEESYIHTKVDFGFGSCNVNPTDKTSKDNGLYIITNEEGKVLAAPISKNGADANVAEWVTLDTQDPQHMPAYQWVVNKTQKSEILLPTSPIAVVNREFAEALSGTIQLRNTEEGALITTSTGSDIATLLSSAKSLTFTPITDEDILGNQYLGYKHLTSSDLMVTKYQFNYLNQFSTDYWIAESEAANDSVLYVRTDAALFGLQEGSTANYGVDPKKYNVEGMAQLVRTNYVIYNNNGKLVETKDNRYAIGEGNYNTAVVDTFFLKENNHLKDYLKAFKKDKISNFYLLYIFISDISYNCALGMQMLILTNILDISSKNATFYFLLMGIIADIFGVLALKKLTPKNDYLTILLKFGPRMLGYSLVFIFPTKEMTLIAITISLFLTTAYENKTDAIYLNRIDTKYQLLFSNIRKLVGSLGNAIGLYLTGILFVFGPKYIFGVAALIGYIQIGLALYLVYLRKSKDCI